MMHPIFISGSRIEKLVAMTNLDDEQALRRFQKIWRYMDLDAELKKKWHPRWR